MKMQFLYALSITALVCWSVVLGWKRHDYRRKSWSEKKPRHYYNAINHREKESYWEEKKKDLYSKWEDDHWSWSNWEKSSWAESSEWATYYFYDSGWVENNWSESAPAQNDWKNNDDWNSIGVQDQASGTYNSDWDKSDCVRTIWNSIPWDSVNWGEIDWASKSFSKINWNIVDWHIFDWLNIPINGEEVDWESLKSFDSHSINWGDIFLDKIKVNKKDWYKTDWNTIDWNAIDWKYKVGDENKGLFEEEKFELNSNIDYSLVNVIRVIWDNVGWDKINWRSINWSFVEGSNYDSNIINRLVYLGLTDVYTITMNMNEADLEIVNSFNWEIFDFESIGIYWDLIFLDKIKMNGMDWDQIDWTIIDWYSIDWKFNADDANNCIYNNDGIYNNEGIHNNKSIYNNETHLNDDPVSLKTNTTNDLDKQKKKHEVTAIWNNLGLDKVDWNSIDWSSIDRSTGNWNIIYMLIYWGQVDFFKIDMETNEADLEIWNNIDWEIYNFNSISWDDIFLEKIKMNGMNWDQIDWNTIDWNTIDWKLRGEIKDYSYEALYATDNNHYNQFATTNGPQSEKNNETAINELFNKMWDKLDEIKHDLKMSWSNDSDIWYKSSRQWLTRINEFLNSWIPGELPSYEYYVDEPALTATDLQNSSISASTEYSLKNSSKSVQKVEVNKDSSEERILSTLKEIGSKLEFDKGNVPRQESYTMSTVRDLVDTIKQADDLLKTNRSWLCTVVRGRHMVQLIGKMFEKDEKILEMHLDQSDDSEPKREVSNLTNLINDTQNSTELKKIITVTNNQTEESQTRYNKTEEDLTINNETGNISLAQNNQTESTLTGTIPAARNNKTGNTQTGYNQTEDIKTMNVKPNGTVPQSESEIEYDNHEKTEFQTKNDNLTGNLNVSGQKPSDESHGQYPSKPQSNLHSIPQSKQEYDAVDTNTPIQKSKSDQISPHNSAKERPVKSQRQSYSEREYDMSSVKVKLPSVSSNPRKKRTISISKDNAPDSKKDRIATENRKKGVGKLAKRRKRSQENASDENSDTVYMPSDAQLKEEVDESRDNNDKVSVQLEQVMYRRWFFSILGQMCDVSLIPEELL